MTPLADAFGGFEVIPGERNYAIIHDSVSPV
jgi:hypothetical protein